MGTLKTRSRLFKSIRICPKVRMRKMSVQHSIFREPNIVWKGGEGGGGGGGGGRGGGGNYLGTKYNRDILYIRGIDIRNFSSAEQGFELRHPPGFHFLAIFPL